MRHGRDARPWRASPACRTQDGASAIPDRPVSPRHEILREEQPNVEEPYPEHERQPDDQWPRRLPDPQPDRDGEEQQPDQALDEERQSLDRLPDLVNPALVGDEPVGEGD